MFGVSENILSEIDYCVRREREECLAAQVAADKCAQNIHRVMARRYAEQVRILSRTTATSQAAHGGEHCPAFSTGGLKTV